LKRREKTMRKGRRQSTRRATVVSIAQARERRRRLREARVNALLDEAFKAGIRPDRWRAESAALPAESGHDGPDIACRARPPRTTSSCEPSFSRVIWEMSV
jgi:hypothetical protein